MEKEEFSLLLAKCRISRNIGKNEACRLTGFTFHQLQRLEDEPNNYAVEKAILYLQALRFKLKIISSEGECIIIENSNSAAECLKKIRKDKLSQRGLADAIGYTYPTIANIERGAFKIKIDLFLKAIDVLGYTIKIEPYE